MCLNLQTSYARNLQTGYTCESEPPIRIIDAEDNSAERMPHPDGCSPNALQDIYSNKMVLLISFPCLRQNVLDQSNLLATVKDNFCCETSPGLQRLINVKSQSLGCCERNLCHPDIDFR